MNIKPFAKKKLLVIIFAVLFIALNIWFAVYICNAWVSASSESDKYIGLTTVIMLMAYTPFVLSQLLFLFQINYLTEHRLRGEAKFCVWSATVISALVNLTYILMIFKVFSPFCIIADIKAVEIIALASSVASFALYVLGKSLANRKGKHSIK